MLSAYSTGTDQPLKSILSDCVAKIEFKITISRELWALLNAQDSKLSWAFWIFACSSTMTIRLGSWHNLRQYNVWSRSPIIASYRQKLLHVHSCGRVVGYAQLVRCSVNTTHEDIVVCARSTHFYGYTSLHAFMIGNSRQSLKSRTHLPASWSTT